MANATADRLLRLSEVRTRTALARSTIYRKMRDGSFPEPLKIGVRAVRWRESEIEVWLAAQPSPELPATLRHEKAFSTKTYAHPGPGIRRQSGTRVFFQVVSNVKGGSKLDQVGQLAANLWCRWPPRCHQAVMCGG